MAAGLRLEAARLDAFTGAFTEHANASISPDQLTACVSVDCEARLEELTGETVTRLEMLAPFGMGNPRPRICLPGLRVDRRPEPFGNGKHLAFMARQGDRWMRMVAWNWGDRRDQIPSGAMIDAVVSPKISSYNQTVEPELADLCIVGTG
jgi:single-stranded-DNA-specific exonuclease